MFDLSTRFLWSPSFDGQFLNQEAIISLEKLQKLEVFPEENRFVAGAGVRWKTVVEQLLPHGLVPFSPPSTGEATLGGSLSCDSYSRFSSGFGKEGKL